MQCESEELNFSSQWHLSDAVLKVGGEKFYVHRCVLSMWSAVLEKELKETSKMSIKCTNPEDVRELLVVIYPTRKPVTQDNAHILLPLAYDLNMRLLISMCEDVLLKGNKCFCYARGREGGRGSSGHPVGKYNPRCMGWISLIEFRIALTIFRTPLTRIQIPLLD